VCLSVLEQVPDNAERTRLQNIMVSELERVGEETESSGARRLPGASEVSGWGAVAPGTVEERVPAGLIDTPGLQHVFNALRAVIRVPGGQK
jgi:hypothetical protein